MPTGERPAAPVTQIEAARSQQKRSHDRADPASPHLPAFLLRPVRAKA
jgi:hypothetical protein